MSLSSVSTIAQPHAQIQSVTSGSRFSKSWLKVNPRLRELTILVLKSLSACLPWPIQLVSRHSPLQKETIAHLDDQADLADFYVQKMYYNELQEKIARLPRSADPSTLLKSIDQTAAQFEALAQHASMGVKKIEEQLQSQISLDTLKKTLREAVETGEWSHQKIHGQLAQTSLDWEVKQRFQSTLDQAQPNLESLLKELDQMPVVTFEQLTQQADHLHGQCRDSLETLKKLPSTDVQRALYTGRLVTTFRRLDDALSDREGKPLHRYCGCPVQVLHQMEGELPKCTSVVVLSRSDADNGIQHAMLQRIVEQGGHTYPIDADDAVLEHYTQPDNAFRLTRYLEWISRSPDSRESKERKIHSFALSLLARGQQDLAITCLQHNTSPAEKAAGRLGMGTLEIAPPENPAPAVAKDVENPHWMAADSEPVKLLRNIVHDCRSDSSFQAQKSALMQPLPPALIPVQNRQPPPGILQRMEKFLIKTTPPSTIHQLNWAETIGNSFLMPLSLAGGILSIKTKEGESLRSKKSLALALAIISSPFSIIGILLKGIGQMCPHEKIRVTDLTAKIHPTSQQRINECYKQVDIFQRVCRESGFVDRNGIPKFIISGGTALGAERHRGMIPWDDDVDVAVLDENGFLALEDKLQEAGLELVKSYRLNSFYKLRFTNSRFKELYPEANYDNSAELDVFIWSKMSDGSWASDTTYSRCNWPGEYVTAQEMAEGVELKPFGPIQLPGLKNQKDYLKRYYGENCLTHGLETHGHAKIFGYVIPFLKFGAHYFRIQKYRSCACPTR